MKRKIKSYGEIPLDVDAINETNRLHLSVIENYMLWPDDETTRQKAINSSFIDYISPHVISLPESELNLYAEIAKKSFPLNYMQEEAKIIFFRGFFVGLVFRECISNKYNRKNESLTSSYNKVLKSFGDKFSNKQTKKISKVTK